MNFTSSVIVFLSSFATMSSEGMITPKCAQDAEKDATNIIAVNIMVIKPFFIVLTSFIFSWYLLEICIHSDAVDDPVSVVVILHLIFYILHIQGYVTKCRYLEFSI